MDIEKSTKNKKQCFFRQYFKILYMEKDLQYINIWYDEKAPNNITYYPKHNHDVKQNGQGGT